MNEKELTRFMKKVAPDPETNCWVWTASIGSHGYGQIMMVRNDKKAPQLAHRMAYEHFVGPIPAGKSLDHLCRNRACCNPKHLDPVTHEENCLRGIAGDWQKVKTHCPHGHEYTPENTRVFKTKNGTGRRCITCTLFRMRIEGMSPERAERERTRNRERMRRKAAEKRAAKVTQ
jgi:hypothetical protein